MRPVVAQWDAGMRRPAKGNRGPIMPAGQFSRRLFGWQSAAILPGEAADGDDNDNLKPDAELEHTRYQPVIVEIVIMMQR